jgi:hypothetical protein
MPIRAGRPVPTWLWLGAALLAFTACLMCFGLLAAVPGRLGDPRAAIGWVAGVCVEWGTNLAGQPQLGLWWESAHPNVVTRRLPPASSLRVLCGRILWSPHLPTRGSIIRSW